jgi:hypothetical protein
MSWIITGTQKNKGLLDEFSGAAAAYSLRNLSLLSDPAVVRVRRDNDNAEQDFTATEVSDGTLAAWVSAGNNGFVRTWYDQSGNGRHQIQPTTAAQPQIVSSGALVTDGGKPSVQYSTGTALYTLSSGLNTGAAFMSFMVYSSTAAAAADTNTMFLYHLGINAVSNNIISQNSSSGAFPGEYVVFDLRRTLSGGERLGSTTYRRLANTLRIDTTQALSTGFSLFSNGSAVTLDLIGGGASTSANYTPANSTYGAELMIGGLPQNTIDNIIVSASQKITEAVFYNSNQSTNRAAIEANINAHYAIY